MSTTPRLVENFFRHEYGKLVSTLCRRVGVHRIAEVEDAVQSALTVALNDWPANGQPRNPSAWLFRVASNNLIDDLRKQNRRAELITSDLAIREPGSAREADSGAGDIPDDLLRMLFVCCDSGVPSESQLAIAMKTLCGFSVREIALRLFTTEANVYKRLARAREKLRSTDPRTSIELGLTSKEYRERLPSVHRILYTLFTEGYLSSDHESAIRKELCGEAIRLCQTLADHPVGSNPETFALLALMYLHFARLPSRQDKSGGLLLLEEQDRNLWDQDAIQTGMEYLARSAEGNHFSRFHAEAGIAAEHCLSPAFSETRWDRIAELYSILDTVSPSSLHTLNRAVAVAEWQGPEAALALLEDLEPPSWLEGSYMWAAVLSDLLRRSGDAAGAERYRTMATSLAPNPGVRQLLERRLSGQHRSG